MLSLCQPGYEALLERELGEAGLAVTEKGPGWTLSAEGDTSGLAFPQLTLLAPREIKGESVNALASQLADWFFGSLRGERIETAWPCISQMVPEMVGLGRRASAVEKAFDELLKKKLSRVAKLAVPELPRGAGKARGLFVFFADFGRLFAARETLMGGQQRMADDDAAPSRSYLKVEEAYIILGREPQPGETVVDLGAAPGGWSYSAAKRGARVIAVDNGPLKGGALNHPLIEHVQADAFGYRPSFAKASAVAEAMADKSAGSAQEKTVGCDWLFCDLVEEPHHVLQNIVTPWLASGWCRHFVVNLKFGHVDSIALLRELRDPGSPLMAHAASLRIRHLYHDREELTLVGDVRG